MKRENQHDDAKITAPCADPVVRQRFPREDGERERGRREGGKRKEEREKKGKEGKEIFVAGQNHNVRSSTLVFFSFFSFFSLSLFLLF